MLVFMHQSSPPIVKDYKGAEKGKIIDKLNIAIESLAFLSRYYSTALKIIQSLVQASGLLFHFRSKSKPTS